MKQLLILTLAIALIVLAACAAPSAVGEDDSAAQMQDAASAELMDAALAERQAAEATPQPSEDTQAAPPSVQNEDFLLTIYVDKDTVRGGEEVVCYAELEYVGTQTLTVLHSDPLLVFGVLGGLLDGSYAVQDSLNRTEFAPGEVARFDFAKSGGYSADDPNAPFLRAFYAEKALILPPGSYTIFAIVEYSTDEDDMIGTQRKMRAGIVVTVSE